MNFDLNQLISHLKVKPVNDLQFCGQNLPGKRRAVFGGQVMAQALSATIQTTAEDRLPHSLHCHFLRAGDIALPIDFDVTIIRDGGSFSLRQVSAQQAGKTIFMATVSFQKPETGLQHQQVAPAMVPREDMISEWDFWQRVQEERPELTYLRPDNFTALEILSRFRPGVDSPPPQEDPKQSFWFKANGKLEAQTDHMLVVAFQSDLLFLNTALHAHPYTLIDPDVQAASLDHCLWFYDTIDATDWLYYDMRSPLSGGGRGLNHGFFYTESGRLVASTAQEGLMRVRAK
ncbi:MAG: acyl-CoA thioesterase II [Ketobacter sp.]|nr:MAG: acyl-CoA thioesterase II [Ketobacter sp.]